MLQRKLVFSILAISGSPDFKFNTLYLDVNGMKSENKEIL